MRRYKNIIAFFLAIGMFFCVQKEWMWVKAADEDIAVQNKMSEEGIGQNSFDEKMDSEETRENEENELEILARESLAVTMEKVEPQENSEVGQTVTIQAKATEPALYQFFVIRNGQEIPLSRYTERNEWQWIPYTPADYQIGVRVKNQDGEAESQEMVEHKVLESTLGINIGTVMPETEVGVNNLVQLQAEASGGIAPYRYQFYVVRDGKEIVFGGYSNRNPYKWMPYTAAQYQIGVRVKDAHGTEREAERIPYSVIPSDLTTKGISLSPEEWSYADEQSVVIEATAIKGKEPYQYQYYVIRNDKEIIIRNYSRERQCIWKPYTVAEYEVGARIKDATGSVVETERKQHSVRRHALEIVDFTSAKQNSFPVGVSTTLKATVAGGYGKKQYRFYVIRDNQEIEICPFGVDNTYTWSPYTPAEYIVCVDVKDEDGSVVTEQINLAIEKAKMEFKTFGVNPEKSAYTGQMVHIRAVADKGIGPYRYRYYVIRDNQEINLTDYIVDQSYLWTPINAADYKVGVEAIDSKGNRVIIEESFRVVKSNLEVDMFYSSKSEGVYQNQQIYLSTRGKGGNGKYQFRYYVIWNGQEKQIRKYSNSKDYIWQPVTCGDYYLCVDIKDS